MEKIVIGVPYEISIEPSIDIGDFNAEIIIKHDDYGIAVELKKMKGKTQDYTFIIPSKLKLAKLCNTLLSMYPISSEKSFAHTASFVNEMY